VVDVLCVEDDDTVRTLAESILQTSGYATLSASTIDQAKALIESEKNINVLFTEIGLLGDVEAGLRLAQEARKQRPDLAVLYTSAQAVTDGMKELFAENSFFFVEALHRRSTHYFACGAFWPKSPFQNLIKGYKAFAA